MMKPADLARRAFACVAAAVLVAATFAPLDADARAGKGGSFGSRGSRTFDAAPPTATTPGGGQAIQRSTTQPGAPGVGNPSTAPRPAAGAAPSRGGMFGGGLMGGIMGGLLGAGLFGLLTGSGFLGGLGSLASMIGLLIQVALVVIVVRFALKWFRNRNQTGASSSAGYPAPAGAAPSPAGYGSPQPTSVNSDRFQYPGGGSTPSYGGGSYGGQQNCSYGGQPAGEVTIAAEDYNAFEKLLTDVQDAWSRQDLGALRALATPEMVQIFADDLADHASDGVANKVSQVKLLQGDLSEAWNENGRDYATVSMRYSLVDVTQDVRTGEVVDGDANQPTEATELWTFMRTSGGRGTWLLSAVQQAEEKKGMFGGMFG